MKFKSLADFPEAFSPLVVVIGDRREQRPKTKGDLLVHSVSSVDVMFMNNLGLPKDTLIFSDKTFVLEERSVLERKFGRVNILTIGSPSVNLFSRQINSTSFFRLFIADDAVTSMKKQEEILDTIKTDKLGLLIYQQILNGNKSATDIATTFKISLNDVKNRFEKILTQFTNTGLKNYKDLMRKFEGKHIIDPVEDGKMNLAIQNERGTFIQDNNDFGFVSLAHNPFSETDDYCCIYVAGRHGPATSHGLRLLATKEYWINRPLGGAYEIQMDLALAFIEKFERCIPVLETDEYKIDETSLGRQYLEMLKKKSTISFFLSAKYDAGSKTQKDKLEHICKSFSNHFKDSGYETKYYHAYNITQGGNWSFVPRIFDLFRDRDFIVHDITSLPLGVICEIGGSLGLNKRLFFIWDKKVVFDSKSLPALIERTDVIEADCSDESSFSRVLKERNFSIDELISNEHRCPAQETPDNEPCEFHSKNVTEKNPAWIFTFMSKNCKLEVLREKLTKKIIDEKYTPKFYEEFTGDKMICKVCKAISQCEYSIIDVTDNYLDGLIILGMMRVRGLKALMIHKVGTTETISMWDKGTKEWHEHSIDLDVSDMINDIKNLKNI